MLPLLELDPVQVKVCDVFVPLIAILPVLVNSKRLAKEWSMAEVVVPPAMVNKRLVMYGVLPPVN